MRKIKDIGEDEMISAFLKAEINSDRFSPTVLTLLNKHGLSKEIIEKPNLSNYNENRQRKELLSEYRGYGKNEWLFTNFPHNVRWARYLLTTKELAAVRYIDWEFWKKVTDNTRLPSDFVRKIKAKELPDDTEIKRVKLIVKRLQSGKKLPEMILVGTQENEKLLVLEGHVRLTVHAFALESLPSEIEVIIGFSDQMSNWDCEENEQLNCVQVSCMEGDHDVAGVFVDWDTKDDGYNDILLAMTGDMVIRIAKGVTIQRGDLLMSAGDGTAKPQDDDIIRSKTIAKVTSTHVSHEYADGSYAVPCVLMAC